MRSLLQNVLEYTGSKADRQIIRKHEFHYATGKSKALKFDVLLVCIHLTQADITTFSQVVIPEVTVHLGARALYHQFQEQRER